MKREKELLDRWSWNGVRFRLTAAVRAAGAGGGGGPACLLFPRLDWILPVLGSQLFAVCCAATGLQ